MFFYLLLQKTLVIPYIFLNDSLIIDLTLTYAQW